MHSLTLFIFKIILYINSYVLYWDCHEIYLKKIAFSMDCNKISGMEIHNASKIHCSMYKDNTGLLSVLYIKGTAVAF